MKKKEGDEVHKIDLNINYANITFWSSEIWGIKSLR